MPQIVNIKSLDKAYADAQFHEDANLCEPLQSRFFKETYRQILGKPYSV